jgi:transcriptional regulator with XRE-family HTH domain
MKAEISQRFGLNLSLARRTAGLSQERLAARAGLHRTEIGLLESAQRMPRIDTVAKLTAALGLGPGDLMKDLDQIAKKKNEQASQEAARSVLSTTEALSSQRRNS